jgi:hypothetical protein
MIFQGRQLIVMHEQHFQDFVVAVSRHLEILFKVSKNNCSRLIDFKYSQMKEYPLQYPALSITSHFVSCRNLMYFRSIVFWSIGMPVSV